MVGGLEALLQVRMRGGREMRQGGSRERPAAKFPLETHSPEESRRVRIRTAGSLVLGLHAGQTVGGESMRLWPIP